MGTAARAVAIGCQPLLDADYAPISSHTKRLTTSPEPTAGRCDDQLTTRYEVHPRNHKRGVDLISDALPFGRLWYDTPDDAIGYAMHSSRSHDAVICVYDAAGNVIETHEHAGGFKEP